MISPLLLFVGLLFVCVVVVITATAVAGGDDVVSSSSSSYADADADNNNNINNDNKLNLHVIEMPGVTLYKMSNPIDIGPVDEDTFPGILPVEFIYKAWNINVTKTNGGKRMINYYKNKKRGRQQQSLLRQQRKVKEEMDDEGCKDNNNDKQEQEQEQCETSATTNDDYQQRRSSSSSSSIQEEDEEDVEEEDTDDDTDDDPSLLFGLGLVERAKEMFQQRNLLHELEYFFETGVSNNPQQGTTSPPRRMYWVGIHIHPNKSLALHSHPNIEFAYIVQGTMYEYRLIDPNYKKKIIYHNNDDSGKEENDAEEDFKYIGPNLTYIHASVATGAATTPSSFQLNSYKEGEMFINTIGDVHQSFTKEDENDDENDDGGMGGGVKLFVLWGNGNADVPHDQYPQNSNNVLNIQSAQAWT